MKYLCLQKGACRTAKHVGSELYSALAGLHLTCQRPAALTIAEQHGRHVITAMQATTINNKLLLAALQTECWCGSQQFCTLHIGTAPDACFSTVVVGVDAELLTTKHTQATKLPQRRPVEELDAG